MKRHYIYFALFVLFFSLPACEMKKEILGQLDEEEMTEPSTEGMGVLDLELNPEREAAIPDTKGATVSSTDSLALDVEAFSIDILNASGTTVVHYDTYADLRDEGGLLLPAGDYTVRASLGDDVNAGFDQPYYAGSTVCTITEQEVAKVVANCTLSNKKMTFRCSERFLEQFDNDYAIVVDNNVGALTTNRTEERTAYLKNTGVLQFTLYATLRDGGRPLTYHYDLSKSGEVQEHNNVLVDLDLIDTPDEEPDEPSDPDEPADPGDPELPEDSVTMQAPIIKVDVSLIEKEFIIEIPSDYLGVVAEILLEHLFLVFPFKRGLDISRSRECRYAALIGGFSVPLFRLGIPERSPHVRHVRRLQLPHLGREVRSPVSPSRRSVRVYGELFPIEGMVGPYEFGRDKLLECHRTVIRVPEHRIA